MILKFFSVKQYLDYNEQKNFNIIGIGL